MDEIYYSHDYFQVSPKSPGSGYVLLHHVMGGVEGVAGAWGYPEGGMGGVSAAIAKSATSSGAEIVTEAQVDKIVVENGRAEGITAKPFNSYRF